MNEHVPDRDGAGTPMTVDDAAAVALLPCPFCGSLAIIRYRFAMTCVRCGSEGPDADDATDGLAAASWNTRAKDAAPQVSVPEGWWLAPEEPSDEMASIFRADAASTTFLTHTTLTCGDFSSRYSAMRAAAQKLAEGAAQRDPKHDLYTAICHIHQQVSHGRGALFDAHEMVSALARFHAYFRDRCEYLFAEFGMEAVNLYNEAAAELRTHAAEAAKTAKVNKNDKRDAERYRWLRIEATDIESGPFVWAFDDNSPSDLDEAIDAAMARGE